MLIAMCSAEAVPFAKTGGLADVAGALPAALKEQGLQCIVFMPFYKTIFGGRFDFNLVCSGLNVTMNEDEEEFYDLLKAEYRGITFYFIKNDKFFDRKYVYGTPRGDYKDNPKRFCFFSKAIIYALEELGLSPDIIHLNDYHCALVSVFLHQIRQEGRPEAGLFRQTSTVFTIHNLAYQGIFEPRMLDYCGLGPKYFTVEGLEFYRKINLIKGGIVFSDKITTVSPAYAKEILTPEYGEGLDGVLRARKGDLAGIVNGIDYQSWDPKSDKNLCENYNDADLKGKRSCKAELVKNCFSVKKNKPPLIGMISRLSEQKGMELVAEAMESIVGLGFHIIILGTGDEKYHRLFKLLHEKYKGSFKLEIGYSDRLARFIYAGCDIFLMPSKYEPCGLGQLISLRYGTIPVVRDTGGLSDTIKDIKDRDDIAEGGTGFKFAGYSSLQMLEALKRARSFYEDKRLWKKIIKNGMKQDFSWKSSAISYKKLYLGLKDGQKNK